MSPPPEKKTDADAQNGFLTKILDVFDKHYPVLDKQAIVDLWVKEDDNCVAVARSIAGIEQYMATAIAQYVKKEADAFGSEGSSDTEILIVCDVPSKNNSSAAVQYWLSLLLKTANITVDAPVLSDERSKTLQLFFRAGLQAPGVDADRGVDVVRYIRSPDAPGLTFHAVFVSDREKFPYYRLFATMAKLMVCAAGAWWPIGSDVLGTGQLKVPEKERSRMLVDRFRLDALFHHFICRGDVSDEYKKMCLDKIVIDAEFLEKWNTVRQEGSVTAAVARSEIIQYAFGLLDLNSVKKKFRGKDAMMAAAKSIKVERAFEVWFNTILTPAQRKSLSAPPDVMTRKNATVKVFELSAACWSSLRSAAEKLKQNMFRFYSLAITDPYYDNPVHVNGTKGQVPSHGERRSFLEKTFNAADARDTDGALLLWAFPRICAE